MFRRLDTPERRDVFIEQFWDVRDPSPGTERNEYRELHYRRIAEAEEKYSHLSPRPVWQTDMGRIYTLLGAPQSFSRLPNTNRAVPIEVWFYNVDPAYGTPPFFYLIFFKGPRRRGLSPVEPGGRRPGEAAQRRRPGGTRAKLGWHGRRRRGEHGDHADRARGGDAPQRRPGARQCRGGPGARRRWRRHGVAVALGNGDLARLRGALPPDAPAGVGVPSARRRGRVRSSFRDVADESDRQRAVRPFRPALRALRDAGSRRCPQPQQLRRRVLRHLRRRRDAPRQRTPSSRGPRDADDAGRRRRGDGPQAAGWARCSTSSVYLWSTARLSWT